MSAAERYLDRPTGGNFLTLLADDVVEHKVRIQKLEEGQEKIDKRFDRLESLIIGILISSLASVGTFVLTLIKK